MGCLLSQMWYVGISFALLIAESAITYNDDRTLFICMILGGYLTVLMDKKIMQRNIHALGLQFLSSVDIIKRLRYHISSVSELCV